MVACYDGWDYAFRDIRNDETKRGGGCGRPPTCGEARPIMRRWGDDLAPSAYADAIYHADLFIIKGRGWMIGGTGKSGAAALASGRDAVADVARDAVAIIREGDSLYGRHDPGAVPRDPVECDKRHRRHRLHFIAYCMNARETEMAYAGRALAMARVDNKMLGWMLANAIYPAELALFYFDRARLSRLFNRALRVTRFLELTDGAAGTQFVVVPWMPTVEARAALYAGHV